MVHGGDRTPTSAVRKRINLLTDNEYCVRLFGDNSIKPRCNKALIQRVRCLLTAVRQHHDLSISWVKAHTGLATPEAVGNATADRFAARGNRIIRSNGAHHYGPLPPSPEPLSS